MLHSRTSRIDEYDARGLIIANDEERGYSSIVVQTIRSMPRRFERLEVYADGPVLVRRDGTIVPFLYDPLAAEAATRANVLLVCEIEFGTGEEDAYPIEACLYDHARDEIPDEPDVAPARSYGM